MQRAFSRSYRCLFVLAVVLLAGDRLAVAVGFAIELAAFLLGDDAVGLCFFLVLLQLVFAFFESSCFAISQLSGLDAGVNAFLLVLLALVDAGRCRRIRRRRCRRLCESGAGKGQRDCGDCSFDHGHVRSPVRWWIQRPCYS